MPFPADPASVRDRGAVSGSPAVEEREVRAADPSLSPRTNARLTEELREVIGAKRVRVPVDRLHASQGERPTQVGLGLFLSIHRLVLTFSVAAVVTFGTIISLTTGNWWFLALAAGLHSMGTMTVWFACFRITTITEHPSPSLAAAMTEDGVRSPDDRFSRMVAEFTPEPQRGVSETLAPQFNERTVPAGSEPVRAGVEQASAMTPTSGPSRSPSSWGTPHTLMSAIALALLLLSIAIPAGMGGGWLWLTAAVMVPVCVCWLLFEWVLLRHPERAHMHSSRPVIGIILGTSAIVAVFCVVVAAVPHH